MTELGKSKGVEEDKPSGKTCFVISPIGEPNTEIRKRADNVLEFVIREALEPMGYNPIRADKFHKSGVVTAQIIEQLAEAPLVVADLTDNNPNVFYELAIRHMARKPYIQIKEPEQRLPFDVADINTVILDVKDLKSVDDAKMQLQEQITSMEDEPLNPISMAIDTLSLKGSSDPIKSSLANIEATLSEIRDSVSSVPDLDKPQRAMLENAVKNLQRTEMEQLENLSKAVAKLLNLRETLQKTEKANLNVEVIIKEISEVMGIVEVFRMAVGSCWRRIAI